VRQFVEECAWACEQGYTLGAGGGGAQAGSAGSASGPHCVAEQPNAVEPVAPPAVRTQCAESEYRVSEFECQPCAALGVELQAAENFNVRWRWSRWTERGTGLCEFECLAPFVLFVSPDGAKICYTPAEYSAHLQLLHSELFLAEPEVVVPPQ